MTDVVKLDPWQTIVNVGWPRGTVSILALEMTYQRNFNVIPEAYTLRNLPFDGGPYDLFKDTIYKADPVFSPDIVNPISQDMIDHILSWSKAPVIIHGEGKDRTGKAIVFFNIARIKSLLLTGGDTFDFTVRTAPGGGTRSETIIVYWVWQTFVSLEEAKEFPDVNGLFAFGDAASRDAYYDNLIGAKSRADEETTQDVWDVQSWTMRARTYRNNRNFPVDEQNVPTWLADVTDSVTDTAANEPGAPGTMLASYNLDFEVNPDTLEIEHYSKTLA